ncbi:MAG: aspartate aminotransferase family protein [Gammaproteobacteria bacterium]|nr:aspartate aminotransferase family protein [Gammaproteobacteria bacterium]
MADIADIVRRREKLLGPNNPLFYEDPVHLVRGEGVWVYDADGRRYLDCYNNVPTVGHCHPHVVEALCRQAGTLNTHTRYLHEGILDYGERLLAMVDDSISNIALTCTGSEANDVAMRMARAVTGKAGFICTNATYHGNTTAVTQMSSIFEPMGGYGPHIRHVPFPDSYRPIDGKSGAKLAAAYADTVRDAIEDLERSGQGFAGFLICPIFANEGLPDIPRGYLREAVGHVRASGGLFIADEVQSAFGRTGRMFGHDPDEAVPDIITLGKPMGNGHPLAGVLARPECMAAFRNQEMYFNTFGGNPVSCAVGMAVLDVLENEGLVENAATTGAYLLKRLGELKERHALIGDVRGRGLFFGIEMVSDREARTPAPEETDRIVNAMRHAGILLSRIGAHGNVLKIRPPLPFHREHADLLVAALNEVLATP